MRATIGKIAEHFRSIFDVESSGRLILVSPLVGVVAGLGAVAFYFLLTLLQNYCHDVEGYYPPPAGAEKASHEPQYPTNYWALVLLPTLGGLACGILVQTFAPEAEGHGTDAMIRAFHRQRGKIRGRVPIIKGIASVLTIGSGGSAGREGPIAQIGAGFGSWVAQKLGMSERDRRLLMLAGGAAGIGAIFRAPLGGALFTAEVLYGSAAVEFEAILPSVIAAVTGYTVFGLVTNEGLVQGTALNLPSGLSFADVREVPFYLVFALLCAIVGYIYVSVFYGMRNHVFRKLPIPKWLTPALGGLLLGLMAIWRPEVMGGGYGWIQQAIHGNLTVTLLLLLCFGKIIATSLTISSGGSGGVFAPSLFIGAMLGGAYGHTCHHFFPGLIQHPEAFVLVGMGGFFAGVAKVPLTSMLMVCEITGTYDLLIPLMIVSFVNVALLSNRWTLYEEQVPTMIDSAAHQGDFVIDVLEQIHVREVMHADRHVDLIPQGMPLPEILQLAASSRNAYFPVVDDNKSLVGIFSLRDLRSVLIGDGAGRLVVALDIATTPVLTITPQDDLHTALRRFTQKNIDDIPVVETENSRKIICMLSRKDVIAAYHDRVTELRHGRQDDSLLTEEPEPEPAANE